MKILIGIVLFIWQLPQCLLGLVLLLLNKTKIDYDGIKAVDSWATLIPLSNGFRKERLEGISLGLFIILDYRPNWNRIVVHEYGHVLQSRILGPLYLLVVGLPSILRAIYAEKVLSKKWDQSRISVWYYSGYPEQWADRLGGN